MEFVPGTMPPVQTMLWPHVCHLQQAPCMHVPSKESSVANSRRQILTPVKPLNPAPVQSLHHARLDAAQSRLSNLWSHAALAHPSKPSATLASTRWRPGNFPVCVPPEAKLRLRDAYVAYCCAGGSQQYAFMSRTQWLSMCRAAALDQGRLKSSELGLFFDRARCGSATPACGNRLGVTDWVAALADIAAALLPDEPLQDAFEEVVMHVVRAAPLAALCRRSAAAAGTAAVEGQEAGELDGGGGDGVVTGSLSVDPFMSALLGDEVQGRLSAMSGPLERIFSFYVREQE
eukprot:15759-Chlamydomonas_euryale.AAC.3